MNTAIKIENDSEKKDLHIAAVSSIRSPQETSAVPSTFRRFLAGVVKVFKYLQRKNREAIEIHNRTQETHDERYRKNGFWIRSLF